MTQGSKFNLFLYGRPYKICYCNCHATCFHIKIACFWAIGWKCLPIWLFTQFYHTFSDDSSGNFGIYLRQTLSILFFPKKELAILVHLFSHISFRSRSPTSIKRPQILTVILFTSLHTVDIKSSHPWTW
jgi:hypothetical protein